MVFPDYFAESKIIVAQRKVASSNDQQLVVTHIELYRRTVLRNILQVLFAVCTGGIGFLLMHWLQSVQIFVAYKKCTSLREAQYAVVHSKDTKWKNIVRLHPLKVHAGELCLATNHCAQIHHEQEAIRTCLFEHLCDRYIYQPESGCFEFVQMELEMTVRSIFERFGQGINSDLQIEERRSIYGPGCIRVPILPIYELIIKVFLEPIYVYQACALALWYSDMYYSYATAILIITVFSLTQEVYDMRQAARKFKELATFEVDQNVYVQKKRAPFPPTGPSMAFGEPHFGLEMPPTICTTETHDIVVKKPDHLVPGDLIELKYGVLPCDMILMQGSVLMKESMLSGESVPRLKTSLTTFALDHVLCSRLTMSHYQEMKYFLYGGTEVVQIKSSEVKPIGLVVRTGFTTAQGQMLSVLLRPEESKNEHFKVETNKFLMALAVIATIGAFISLAFSFHYNLQPEVKMIRFFDTFTNIIAPVLPASMAISCTFAVQRLKYYRKVLCLQASSISVAGEVNTMVFDKTGTLTEEDLNIDGFALTRQVMQPSFPAELRPSNPPSISSVASHEAQRASTVADDKSYHNETFVYVSHSKTSEMLPLLFLEAMASCHTLSYWGDHLVGEMLEIQLLKATPFHMKEHASRQRLSALPGYFYTSEIVSEDEIVSLKIIQQYEFQSEVQRMSVMFYHSQLKKVYVVCKGSPEQLESRCVPATIPDDYNSYLKLHTHAGKRVIAYGYKEVPLSGVHAVYKDRDNAETHLNFLGFVFFMNQLRPDTVQVISDFQRSGVHCMMATGDNAITSLAIGKECGLIDSKSHEVCLLGSLIETPANGAKSDISNDESVVTAPSCTYTPSDSSSYVSGRGSTKTLVWKKVRFGSNAHSDHYPVKIARRSHAVQQHKSRALSSVETMADRADQLQMEMNTGRAPSGVIHTDYQQKQSRLSDTSDPEVCCTLASTPVDGYQDRDDVRLPFFPLLDTHKDPPHQAAPSSTLANLGLNALAKNGGDWTDDIITTEALLNCLNGPSVEIANPGIILVMTGPAFRYANLLCKSNPAYNINKDFTEDLCPYYAPDEYFCVGNDPLLPRSGQPPSTSAIGYSLKNSVVASTKSHISLYEYLLRMCRIYARMTPQDKALLVRELQHLDGKPRIGMCGDGSNDCEALKAANFGISLTGEVVSICAHVTSMTKSIRSAYDVLCEGRGTIVNGFSSCIYIIMYALVQFTSVMILYSYGGNLSDEQFMFIDLPIILPLVVASAWTHGADVLTKRLPPNRLISLPVLSSVIGQFTIQFGFLLINLAIVTQMSFYVRFVPDSELNRFEADNLIGYENTVVFFTSLWQYLILNLVLYRGTPWRKPRTSNWSYVAAAICVTLEILLIWFSQELIPGFAEWLGLIEIPLWFRLLLLLSAAMNGLVSIGYHECVIKQLVKRDQVRNLYKSQLTHPVFFKTPRQALA